MAKPELKTACEEAHRNAGGQPIPIERRARDEVPTSDPKPRGLVLPTFADRKSVVKVMSTLGVAPKDEFESTKDYDNKKCATFRREVGGAEDTVFHFIVFGRDSPLSQAHYDADKQEYRFLGNEIFPPLYTQLSTKTGIGLILAKISTPGKSYIGKNAFGVAKEISVSTERTLAVLIPTSTRFFIGKFILHAEPDFARELKGDLQLVVSTKIVSPCLDSGMYYSKPTIDLPTETTDKLIGLVGAAGATWEIVRTSTGEVLTSGHF
jgi:hypothetical protein